MTILSCENVGMRYGHGPEILRDVSLTIEKNAFCLLVGPSGAGKTSLLSLFFLARQPSRGLIRIFDQDVSLLPPGERSLLRRRMGIVFQEFRLISHMTVYENIALPLRARGERQSRYRSDVLELIEWVGLAERRDAYPPTLSGGEKQRAAVARAVVGGPDILMADEPTGNIDPENAERILHLFAEMNRMGTSVILATHTPSLSRPERAAILHLEEGRLSYG